MICTTECNNHNLLPRTKLLLLVDTTIKRVWSDSRESSLWSSPTNAACRRWTYILAFDQQSPFFVVIFVQLSGDVESASVVEREVS